MKFKKAMAFALTGALTAGAVCSGVFADSTTVKLTVAERYDTDYIMTIPAEVNVAGAGFTALEGGIKVSHNSEKTTEFDPNSKVTVSAASANEWQLKATGVADGIGYQLKGSAEDNAATTSWEFTGDKITNDGETKAVGVDVENYDDAAPGDYTDTITFTAEVESSSVAVTGITLNKTSTTIAKVNGAATETLSVTAVTPDDATDKTYTWSSDNESVATVDADGKVTAVAAGAANITATANDGSGVTATCAVTVTDLSAYYSKMVECGCDDLDGKCADFSNPEFPFTGQVLSADQAIALAKAKAAETNSNCAVFYDNGVGMDKISFAKNDGTTGSANFYDTPSAKGLSGYRGYYVSK